MGAALAPALDRPQPTARPGPALPPAGLLLTRAARWLPSRYVPPCSWSPLLDLPDEWAIGIESIEVEGPGGGTVSSELWPPPAAPVPAAAPEAAASGARPVESAPDAGTFSSSGGSSSDPVANTGRSGAALEDQPASPDAPPSRLEQRLRRLAQAAESSGSSGSSQRQYATCFVDSGTTFVVLPRPAWQAFQRLIISAAAALGKTKLVQQAAGATCWESSVPGSLAGNASALEAAFPRIRLSFVGSANFTADGRGFLTSPDSGGERYACLSFFPWCARGGRRWCARGVVPIACTAQPRASPAPPRHRLTAGRRLRPRASPAASCWARACGRVC